MEVELDDMSEQDLLPAPRHNTTVNVRNSTDITVTQKSSDCGSAALGFLAGFFFGPLGCLCGLCSSNKPMYYCGYFFPAIMATGCLLFFWWMFFGAIAIGTTSDSSHSNSPWVVSASSSPSNTKSWSATPSKSIQMTNSLQSGPSEVPQSNSDSNSSPPLCMVGQSSSIRVNHGSTSTFGGFYINQVANRVQKYYYNATVHSTNKSDYSIGWYEYGCYTETSAGCSSHFDYRYLLEDTINGNAVTDFVSSVQYSPYSFGAIYPVIKCNEFWGTCDITITEYVSCSQEI